MERAHEEAAHEEARSATHPHTSLPADTEFLPTEHEHEDDNESPTEEIDTQFLPTDSGSDVSPKTRPISGVVPPYWQRHERNASRASQSSLARSTMITLEDNTVDPESETTRGLWAQSVSIEDHVVVQGKTGVGAYVVWNCKIQTLDGGPMVVRMRYSEFDELRQRLVSSFPHAKNYTVADEDYEDKFRPNFLENRRVGLEYFLNCVLLNPEFSSSPIVKDFLFGRLS
ncbi:uncharacterized protein N7483_005929 [Penicillium malachiteum]|uniref:uncharacterized protein n=1 Tax=Penicillium malachiteum TaxID=1324776 RepID=UPI002547DE56|nr:uncharacterized protein N7483_005929 [Penicillium malachiteum]KAJ5731421.1 hypothetical protein N7483_005929 [Penicillium malachiteum]